jgi:hypothetical protein
MKKLRYSLVKVIKYILIVNMFFIMTMSYKHIYASQDNNVLRSVLIKEFNNNPKMLAYSHTQAFLSNKEILSEDKVRFMSDYKENLLKTGKLPSSGVGEDTFSK